MLAHEARRPYPHPYEVRSPRHLPSSGDVPDTDDTQPASIPSYQIRKQPLPPKEAAPPQTTPPELTARTVHRLRHIRQVSDQAISVIDQALHHVP
jgi:hypothetical protein